MNHSEINWENAYPLVLSAMFISAGNAIGLFIIGQYIWALSAGSITVVFIYAHERLIQWVHRGVL